MIQGFADQGTEDVFNGSDTKAARRTCPSSLVKVARRKLDMVNAATVLGDLRIPPSNQLEALQPPRRGQHSIRINDKYRVCFTWKTDGPHDVEIVDYHR
jgi:proteic killer suppression protein